MQSLPQHTPAMQTSPATLLRQKLAEVTAVIDTMANQLVRELEAAQQRGLDRINGFHPDDRYMTTKEVAAYLGFSVKTIHAWTSGRNPRIPYMRIAGEKRFRKDAIDATMFERNVS